MNSKNSSIAKEVAFGFLPVKKSERTFGFWDLLFIQVGIGLSSIFILTGGYIGTLLNAKEAIAVILLGNAIPILLYMPISVFFARYGVDTFIGFRSALGYLGTNITYVLFTLMTLGFIALFCFMTGKSAIQVSEMIGIQNSLASVGIGAPFFAIASFFIAAFIAYKGPSAIKGLNWIGVPAILMLLIGLLIALFYKEGLSNLFALQPSAPYESKAESVAVALELSVGLGFSWLFYIGQYSRLAKNEKVAFSGGFWSYGVLVNVAAILGALSAIVVGSLEPTEWMLAIGGVSGGLIGLILLMVGNISASVFLIYSQAISFKTIFPRQKWGTAIAASLPAVILMITPAFYDAYSTFIAFVSYILAVLGGIVVTDFFFVKKQSVSVRYLYDQYGMYKYWKGINPSAFISLVVGTACYWLLYNPFTMDTSIAFLYMTAGLPTFFVSSVSYYMFAKYVFSFEADRYQAKTVNTEQAQKPVSL
ncbi:purine-cytosine permease family protein [Peribacillus sp. TH14]|uniref:purine-cytosine permease family protein n=1 Tax=Peribacillus sp. TH14 TaxID=2798481 RepID=UPI00191422F1|nr:cytosine permease [Peribacillus sp. TH14]MBK5501392.1 cytosine permease [Peribacillus sp. TH14]